MVPLQMMLARTGLPDANANSLAAVVPISVAGGLVYYFGGSRPAMDLPFAGLLMLGGVVGAFAGARLTRWIPEPRLRQFVVVVLVLVGLKEMILP